MDEDQTVVKRLRPDGAESLAVAVTAGVEAVTPSDAAGWFGHCGYLHQCRLNIAI